MTNGKDTVRVLNTVTGQIAVVPRTQFEHPVFGRCLVEVKDEVKPYAAPLYQGKTVEEFQAAYPHKLPDAEVDVNTEETKTED